MGKGEGSCPPDFGAPLQNFGAVPQMCTAQIRAVACIWKWGNFSHISRNSLRNFFNILIDLLKFIKVFSSVLQIICKFSQRF